jgi:hypothetical protein
MDPDPYWKGRIQEHGNRPKFQNKPGLLPFKTAFVPSDPQHSSIVLGGKHYVDSDSDGFGARPLVQAGYN